MYCAGGTDNTVAFHEENKTEGIESYTSTAKMLRSKYSRGYILNNINLYTHVLEFEQEVHRSLEAIVVQHGIFIHYPTFFEGPITNSVNEITPTHNINIHAKSINSIHGVWLDKRYETDPYRRRLDFVAPKLSSIQIRNGTEYIPSLPIEMTIPSTTGKHSQMLIETYKAWNKMHNPALDSALTCSNYQKTHTSSYRNFRNLQEIYVRQANLGRF